VLYSKNLNGKERRTQEGGSRLIPVGGLPLPMGGGPNQKGGRKRYRSLKLKHDGTKKRGLNIEKLISHFIGGGGKPQLAPLEGPRGIALGGIWTGGDGSKETRCSSPAGREKRALDGADPGRGGANKGH